MRILLVLVVGVMLATGGYCDAAPNAVPSTAYVDKQTENQVKTVGDQEIAGTKTYKASPIVPTPDLPE